MRNLTPLRSLSSHFGPLSFYREALAIALPAMGQQLVVSFVSLIDNFMVAGLGDISMAAVNVCNQINFIFLILIQTISMAGGIYLAQFKGAGNSEGMKHSYRFKIIFAFGASTAFFMVCQIIPHHLISLMTMGNAAQDGIVAMGARYQKLIAWTFFPIAVSMPISHSFREIARPKVSLLVSSVASLVNVAGNWVLIYGNLGAPALGVEGAAIATIIARLFEAAIFISYSAFSKAPFFVGIGKIFKINKKLIAEILVKSVMVFVSEMSWAFSETILTAMYNRRGGAETVAGMAAGWTIANLFFLIFSGIWTATGVLVGGTLGAGKLDEARTRAKWLKSGSVVAGFIVAIPGAAISFLLVPLAFFNLTPDAVSICLNLVLVILAYLPLFGLLNMQFAISRAGGDAAMGMYVDLSVNTFLFVPGAVALSYFTAIPPVPMFAILKLTDIVKSVFARYLLAKERWVKNLTLSVTSKE
jgi:putative MATE family efflux protein